MNLHISPHTDLPIYRQIQQQIARAISERRLRPGESLLPEHELARQLVVSPAAVHKAYLELESAGLCDRDGSGPARVIEPGLESIDSERMEIALSLLERELLTRELRTARRFQRRLLPADEIRRDRWTVCSRSYPAGCLAGDFYDVIEPRVGLVDVILADVAGKGVAAGLIMAATKSLLPLVATEASPGRALTALNERLCDTLDNREFVAMVYARFDAHSGLLELANAGIPDPALLRRNGKIEWLQAAGSRLPIGARRGSRYSTSRFELDTRDRMLLLTDGIPEAIDGQGQTFGYESLHTLLEEMVAWRPDTSGGQTGPWLDHFIDEVSHRTSSHLTDDWSAMLLEFHPDAEEARCSS